MKNLIFTKDNSIETNGAIGIQTCGIVNYIAKNIGSKCYVYDATG